MNKATLNQIATYSPINTFLAFSRGESRGRDTYGYPIIRLKHSHTGEVFKCMGGGYCMVGTNLGQYIIGLTKDYPEALKALSTFVYDEVQKGQSTPYGLSIRNLDKCKDKDGKLSASKIRRAINEQRFYIDGACGENCMKRIADGMGLILKDEYIRAKTRKGTDKYLGLGVSLNPKGLLVKYLAKTMVENS